MSTLSKGDGCPSIVENTMENSLHRNWGISIDWTFEEQSIFEYLIKKYASQVPIDRYAKIAQALPDKLTRDVALRNKWLEENGKDKRDDISGNEIFSYNSIAGDNTIAAGDNIENLLEYNAKVLDQIQANFLDNKIHENIDLLSQARTNIRTIMNDLPEPFHHGMPPFPFKINEELANSILPPRCLPKF